MKLLQNEIKDIQEHCVFRCMYRNYRGMDQYFHTYSIIDSIQNLLWYMRTIVTQLFAIYVTLWLGPTCSFVWNSLSWIIMTPLAVLKRS
jgi:predicted metal-dependent HD superfamily phosphohydrolase